jgi:hypothetical protein
VSPPSNTAAQVAAFPEHRGPLLAHLLSFKLRHWDRPTRALAARALAALAPAAGPDWLAAHALPALLERVTDDALEARCGAVLGLAELLPALAAAGMTDVNAAAAAAACQTGGDDVLNLQQAAEGEAGSLSARVARVLCVLEGARLYRGKGGELMRDAAARLVDCLAQAVSGLRRGGGPGGSQAGSRGGAGSPAAEEGSAAAGGGGAATEAVAQPQQPQQQPRLVQSGAPRLSLPLGPEYHAAALALIEDCICHPLAAIRASGAAALASHARAHGCAAAAEGFHGLLDRCLARLADPNVAHRRGAAEALGALPADLLLPEDLPSGPAEIRATVPQGRASEVVAALCAAAAAGGLPPDQRDVESRVAAVEALGRLSVELHSAGQAAAASTASAAPQTAVGSDGGPAAAPSALLSARVVPCLLAALGDYTTDNRGDVGSWVRGAAMEALVAVVPLAVADQDGLGSSAGAVEAAGADQGHQQPRAAASSAGAPAAAVGEMLRIAVERIARLREAAVAHAAALLAQPAVRAGGFWVLVGRTSVSHIVLH